MSKDIEKLIETLERNVRKAQAHEYTWYLEDHPGDRMCKMDERDLYIPLNKKLVFVYGYADSEEGKKYEIKIKENADSQPITEFNDEDFPEYSERIVHLYETMFKIDNRRKMRKERMEKEFQQKRDRDEKERHKQDIGRIVGKLT
jgi:heme oxygenase